ncbi:MAG: hypothetical protein J0M16_10810 [Gammaproteobacteria bacterium]|nr:hypothetical protein [Gammaproteobacteria bacterium]
MQRFRVLLALWCCLLAGGVPARAADAPAPILPEVAELYRLSGLEKQLEGIESQIATGLTDAVAALPEADRERFVAAVRGLFAEPALRPAVLERVGRDWNPGHAAKAIAWLAGPNGRRVTLAEESVSTTAGASGMAAFLDGLATRPLPPSRVAAVRRVNEAYGTADFVFDAAEAVALAIVGAANAILPEDRRVAEAAVRDQVAANRRDAYAEVEEQTLAVSAYTYRDLPDSDLADYAGFLESPAGRWYTTTMLAAMLDAERRQAAGLVPALEGFIKPRPAP